MNDDLISRKALLSGFDVRKVTEYDESGCGVNYKAVPVKAIEAAPAVDAKRVLRGEWIEKPYLLGTTRYCSRCGANYGMPHGVFNYCPNCGAKMDKEKKI